MSGGSHRPTNRTARAHTAQHWSKQTQSLDKSLRSGANNLLAGPPFHVVLGDSDDELADSAAGGARYRLALLGDDRPAGGRARLSNEKLRWVVLARPGHERGLPTQPWRRSHSLKAGRKFALFYFEVDAGAQTQLFRPTHYLDITETEERKRKACYAHTDGPQFYPRYHDLMNRFRGLECGCKFAEAFVHHHRGAAGTLP